MMHAQQQQHHATLRRPYHTHLDTCVRIRTNRSASGTQTQRQRDRETQRHTQTHTDTHRHTLTEGLFGLGKLVADVIVEQGDQVGQHGSCSHTPSASCPTHPLRPYAPSGPSLSSYSISCVIILDILFLLSPARTYAAGARIL